MAVVFGDVLQSAVALISGDNLGALNVALNLSSTSTAMNTLARKIAWRLTVFCWQYRLEHLPADQNDEVDALSRLYAVPSRNFLRNELLGAMYVIPPAQSLSLWKARLSL